MVERWLREVGVESEFPESTFLLGEGNDVKSPPSASQSALSMGQPFTRKSAKNDGGKY
jgi:hypothetical protein